MGFSSQYLGAQLNVNQIIYGNQYIMSDDNRFLLILQDDGNLVLYGPGYIPLWSAGTAGKGGTHLTLQSDGNLVLYTANNVAVWASGTHNSGANELLIQNDGNAVLYSPNGAKWSTGTGGHAAGPSYAGTDQLSDNGTLLPNTYLRSADHRYVLVLQADGNLVLYGPAWHSMWASSTAGHSPTELLLQDDGNLVLYGSGGAYWSTATVGTGANQLVAQDDGNLVLYGPSGAIWATSTAGRT